VSWEGKPRASNEQAREYGYQAAANGDDIAVMRAHLALSIPVSPTWERAWRERDEARAVIAWDIARDERPYGHLASISYTKEGSS
jgi:hypothetical protein